MVATDNNIGMVRLLGCRCRCGHEWLPRNIEEKPRVCPSCKSPNWDKPLRHNKIKINGISSANNT